MGIQCPSRTWNVTPRPAEDAQGRRGRGWQRKAAGERVVYPTLLGKLHFSASRGRTATPSPRPPPGRAGVSALRVLARWSDVVVHAASPGSWGCAPPTSVMGRTEADVRVSADVAQPRHAPEERAGSTGATSAGGGAGRCATRQRSPCPPPPTVVIGCTFGWSGAASSGPWTD